MGASNERLVSLTSSLTADCGPSFPPTIASGGLGMTRRYTWQKWYAPIGIAGLISGVLASGVAVAAAPAVVQPVDKFGSIHSCYNTGTGALTVVNPGASCPAGWSPLSWAQGPGWQVIGAQGSTQTF